MEKYIVVFVDNCFYPAADLVESEQNRIECIEIVEERLSDIVSVEKIDPFHVMTDANGVLAGADLIIVDYKLDNHNGSYPIHIRTGNEIVSSLRSKAKDTPIYLLSVMINDEQIYGRSEAFERLITEGLLSGENFLRSELEGHRKLKNAIRNDIDCLVSIFNCPAEQILDLQNALPVKVKTEFRRPERDINEIQDCGIGLSLFVYRWIVDDFMKTPGLLYDSEYCAVFLGVKHDYFKENIEDSLDACLYDGIFSKTFEKHWWSSLILDWIIDQDDNGRITGINDQSKIVDILNIEEIHHSICEVCGGKFPEALGVEDGSKKLYFVHIGCSSEPIDNRLSPYFIAPRRIQ